MGFYRCIKYLAITGIISFVLGRIIPKTWFLYDRFPYKIFPFECDGRIYEKSRIRVWHKKVPDMSRIFPKLMPAKKIAFNEISRLPEMIQETCVAEFIHGLLCITGLHCIAIWQGTGGILLAILNIIGNLPFILIQRYNRPRLIRLMNNTKKKRDNLCEC